MNTGQQKIKAYPDVANIRHEVPRQHKVRPSLWRRGHRVVHLGVGHAIVWSVDARAL